MQTNGLCANVNECQEYNVTCAAPTLTCVDTFGSFACECAGEILRTVTGGYDVRELDPSEAD
eukprot:2549428-Rhodomonas_salina.1